MIEDREVAWVIETFWYGRPAWWDGESPANFTHDANKAVRFARGEDASRVLYHIIPEPQNQQCKVTEHVWLLNVKPGADEVTR